MLRGSKECWCVVLHCVRWVHTVCVIPFLRKLSYSDTGATCVESCFAGSVNWTRRSSRWLGSCTLSTPSPSSCLCPSSLSVWLAPLSLNGEWRRVFSSPKTLPRGRIYTRWDDTAVCLILTKQRISRAVWIVRKTWLCWSVEVLYRHVLVCVVCHWK